MAMHPVIDDLDRCKIALQYIAEDSPTISPLCLSCWSSAWRTPSGRPPPTCASARARLRPASGDAQCYAARCPHRPPRLPADASPFSPERRCGSGRRGGGPGPDASPAGAEGSREQHLGASHSPAAFDFPYVIE